MFPKTNFIGIRLRTTVTFRNPRIIRQKIELSQVIFVCCLFVGLQINTISLLEKSLDETGTLNYGTLSLSNTVLRVKKRNVTESELFLHVPALADSDRL